MRPGRSSRFAAFKTFVLGAQRFDVKVPSVIRRPARVLLRRLTAGDTSTVGVEDWSSPLIGGPNTNAIDEPMPEPPVVAPHASSSQARATGGSRSPQQRRQNDGRRRDLRCLLATGTLDVGGLEEVVAFLGRRLPECGIQTAVLHAATTDGPGGMPGGRLGRMLAAEGVQTSQWAKDAGVRWLETWRPDVISAHGAPAWVLEAAAQLSIPCVETLHMPAFMSEDPTGEPARAKYLSGIVAVSDLLRRQYLDLNPSFSQDLLVTIPNGVDDSRRGPGNRAAARARWGIDHEYVFVSLARHSTQKNGYGLVAAFGDLAERCPDAHLVVAGRPDDPVYFSQVARLRDSLSCRDRIHLRDHHPNPSELLALADGFVLNSFFEGWSLASMEALYAGIPVVLSDVGGAREQVANDEARGRVVANPVGDAVQVNWETIRASRFVRQANRERLVDAMISLVETRTDRLAARQTLSGESAGRFRPAVCLARHAETLAMAATSRRLPTQAYLDQLSPN
jgi:glycosyltransferase involved in cell wall biosynthesis